MPHDCAVLQGWLELGSPSSTGCSLPRDSPQSKPVNCTISHQHVQGTPDVAMGHLISLIWVMIQTQLVKKLCFDLHFPVSGWVTQQLAPCFRDRCPGQSQAWQLMYPVHFSRLLMGGLRTHLLLINLIQWCWLLVKSSRILLASKESRDPKAFPGVTYMSECFFPGCRTAVGSFTTPTSNCLCAACLSPHMPLLSQQPVDTRLLRWHHHCPCPAKFPFLECWFSAKLCLQCQNQELSTSPWKPPPSLFMIEKWCPMCLISRTGNGCPLGREMAQSHLWQSVPWSNTGQDCNHNCSPAWDSAVIAGPQLHWADCLHSWWATVEVTRSWAAAL